MITLTREEAQQVLDALQCATPPTFSTKLVEDWQSAVELLRTRLAQPEPEPVACAACSGRGWYTCGASDMRLKCPECKGKKAAPPQRVYCSCGDGIVPDDGALCGICVSLKKMREWQGLTDEEMSEAMDYWSDPIRSAYGGADSANDEYVDMVATWRYIEAKLREKNRGE